MYRHSHKQIVPKLKRDGSPWPDQKQDEYNVMVRMMLLYYKYIKMKQGLETVARS